MARFAIIAIFTALLSVGLYFLFNINLHGDPTLGYKPGEPRNWGKSDSKHTEVKPFQVKVSDELLADLKRRLENWREPTPTIDGVGYSYGIPSEKLGEIVKYWREKYDWRKAEVQLNLLPQFQTVINGLNVHFIHAKADPSAKVKVPLLLVHGWPGSVWEFYKTIPLLTANRNGMAFDVVAPSIPGYVFSEAPSKPGFNPMATSEVFLQLMKRLGYEKFVYQGGDWGSIIGNVFAHMFPDSLIGYHSNMATPANANVMDLMHLGAAMVFPELVVGKEEAWKIGFSKLKYILEESGYFHEQATKPDTLGVGLSDSPVGLAGWIMEKFAAWAQHVEFKSGKGLTNDEMLTNVMLYWITNHATSSVRFYKEYQNSNAMAWISHSFGTVPTAVACYPAEMICFPKSILTRNMPRLVHHVDMPQGGHFAAFEEPEIFSNDLRKAVVAFIKVREEEDKWGTGLGLGI